ncbi:MAG: hypothetical protein WC729_06825 [Sphingomonas sp.]|jgi:hypothetical protein|uniref:hypothetical protein n=1 Tax=Sphingomonas sp. TaxID=28214 RepID=UPI003564422F
MDNLTAKKEACRELGDAVDDGSMGKIVAKHEAMILEYYTDVQGQATKSFAAAKAFAYAGLAIFSLSLIYMLTFDALSRLGLTTPPSSNSITISSLSIISGGVMELVAGGAFWLYARSAKQFGAFHICLERTHRYLLAFKIAERSGDEKDKVLRDLVCIMANAPMISHDYRNEPIEPTKRE